MIARFVLAALLLVSACSGRTDEAATPSIEIILSDTPAKALSDYGLFADQARAQPAKGVVAYDLVNPLFSDHAIKHRFVFVPGDQKAKYSAADAFDFPVGTVLVKTFSL